MKVNIFIFFKYFLFHLFFICFLKPLFYGFSGSENPLVNFWLTPDHTLPPPKIKVKVFIIFIFFSSPIFFFFFLKPLFYGFLGSDFRVRKPIGQLMVDPQPPLPPQKLKSTFSLFFNIFYLTYLIY